MLSPQLETETQAAAIILNLVAFEHGTTPGALRGHVLTRELNAAREEAYRRVAAAMPSWGDVQLGRFFNRSPERFAQLRRKARNVNQNPAPETSDA